MTYAIPAPSQPTLAINGSDDLFPARRIYCIGRNYAEHAREMGHDPDKAPPFFFEKHPSCLLTGEGQLIFPYPSATQDVHHEIELVVALKAGGKDLSAEEADKAIFGYAVGVDLTRRDLQAEAKKQGRPWAVAKSFDYSAPCSALTCIDNPNDIANAKIWLDRNGERVQTGTLDQMIWPVRDAIAYLSTLFELFPGDLIMTGTPAGVGPVVSGDILQGGVEGVGEVQFLVK
ncbi:fumarylacetoacetate hydrolase family protein [Ahrensia sp. 13_GOM-1096m]|uniref:fumarylacetoacetate hydrolase family protein n=1 Tax=Ahrensia sp. 13_GOM-1096m TaxID=1380380 RepID=UPI00047EC25A|nr:fumarylacetoacetate hydrolase family protein [Ahrensia sp. 13_GOM-1096m]